LYTTEAVFIVKLKLVMNDVVSVVFPRKMAALSRQYSVEICIEIVAQSRQVLCQSNASGSLAQSSMWVGIAGSLKGMRCCEGGLYRSLVVTF